MVWRIALTDEAWDDLEHVVAFLAQEDPAMAERIGLELVARIFSLDQMPSRGAQVRLRPGLRKIVHRHYLIIYRINDAARLVEVIRVWDGRQDPQRLSLPAD